MHPGTLLALSAGALSLLGLGLAVMLLRGDPVARQLEARMRSIALPSGAESGAAGRERDIRRPSGGGSLLVRLQTRLGRSPEMPAEWRLPWPVVLGIGGGGALALGYGAALVVHPLAAPFLGLAAAGLLARAIFGWETQRYRTKLFVQLPEAMGLILRAIRAGLPMAEALANVAREVPSPSREEFGQVVSAVSIGQPLDAALFRMAERSGLAEYFFFAVTVGLQASTGGNMGETLENLAEMVRKRVAMVGRVKALTGEARMSAVILGSLPFVAGAAIGVMTPGHLTPLFTTDTGQQMLLIGIGLLVTGLLAIRGLLRSAVKD